MLNSVTQEIVAALNLMNIDLDTPTLSNSIANALYKNKSKNLLVINETTSEIYFLDTFKAITGLAGLLGSIAGLTLGVNVAAAAALVASLGSLKGVRSLLTQDEGLICAILYEHGEDFLSEATLRKEFEMRLEASPIPGVNSDQLDEALRQLASAPLKIIKRENGAARLNQQIMLQS